MLLVETSWVPIEMKGESQFRPWMCRRRGKQRHGPSLLVAVAGEVECRFQTDREPKFTQKSRFGSSQRLGGFGSGAYRFGVDPHYSKLVQTPDSNGGTNRLVRCEKPEDEVVILGFFCARCGHTSFELKAVGARVLFERCSNVHGLSVIMFAACLEQPDGYLLVENVKQGGLVSQFSIHGHHQVSRKDLKRG